MKALDREGTKLNEDELDDLEDEYLRTLKDVNGRLNTIQDETAKLKMEYQNGVQRLEHLNE